MLAWCPAKHTTTADHWPHSGAALSNLSECANQPRLCSNEPEGVLKHLVRRHALPAHAARQPRPHLGADHLLNLSGRQRIHACRNRGGVEQLSCARSLVVARPTGSFEAEAENNPGGCTTVSMDAAAC